MKKFLLSLMVLCCALAGMAQATTDVPKAVLQHGDQVSVFQGAGAFQQAMDAAVNGDVITLSDGQFVPAPINKSVSIYGAGYVKNAETGTAQSCLYGNVFIGAQGDTLCNVHLEGVLITNGSLYVGYANNNSTKVPLKNLTIEKCWMSQAMQMGSYNENLTLKQCVLASGLIRGLSKNTLITNCLLYGSISGFTEEFEILIDHSLSTGYNISGNNGQGITWTNCVFGVTTNLTICGWYCVVKNCLKGGGNLNNFNTGTVYENIYTVSGIEQMFADAENASFSANRTFELQQPDVWIGTDGTPVGPSGGIGWSTVPRVPVIKSLELNVEGQQLHINYEAEARD